MKRGSFLLPFGKRGNLHLPFVFPLNPFSTLTRRQRVLPKAARFIYNPHVGIEARPIPADHRQVRPRGKPSRHRIRVAIGEQIGDPVALVINDDGAIAASFPPRPVVDPDDAQAPLLRVGQSTNHAQEGVRTGAHPQPGSHTRARFSTRHHADVLQCSG